MKFQELNISEDILQSLMKMNFEKATPVQGKTIPPMTEGRDVVVLAPTGSGKTVAFGVPILENLEVTDSSVQVLILCPTRELALQIVEVFYDLIECKSGVRVQALYGGEPIERQIKALKKKPQIIVATPGRLIDHMNRRTVRLGNLHTVVLDEADRMFDMGFSRDMKTILDAVPEERQTVMFSATMPPEILRIAQKYQQNAQRIDIGGAQKPVESVTQYYAEIDSPREKEAALVELLRDERYGLALVFTSRKHLAKGLARTLMVNGFRAAALQGNMSQPQRNRVMAEYRRGELDVLVATDVAARGIDVNDIDIVVNFDLPQDADSYTHRIGRTGRAGKSGDAYTFVSQKERSDFKQMVLRTDAEMELVFLDKARDFISKKASKLEPTSLDDNRFDRSFRKNATGESTSENAPRRKSRKWGKSTENAPQRTAPSRGQAGENAQRSTSPTVGRFTENAPRHTSAKEGRSTENAPRRTSAKEGRATENVPRRTSPKENQAGENAPRQPSSRRSRRFGRKNSRTV
ncbi:hypothetical protein FACS1894127_2450 [Clostridia bacterium]|nr:hypothetical protein FACS1894127_2450 [Clostridia bacterium]